MKKEFLGSELLEDQKPNIELISFSLHTSCGLPPHRALEGREEKGFPFGDKQVSLRVTGLSEQGTTLCAGLPSASASSSL